MTRVLLGTPLYSSPCPEYVSGLVGILKMEDAEYIPMFAKGTYLSQNRQMLVQEARKLGCEEILFIDSDMACSSEHVARIRSHDVDVVGGVYPKKRSGKPEWLLHLLDFGWDQPGNDLHEVNDIAAGFLRIRMSVFDRLDAKFLERRYQNGGEPPQTEYFPHGLMMPGSHLHPAEAKLEALLATLRDFARDGVSEVDTITLQSLLEPETGKEAVFPETVGEDYGFFRLLRSAGIACYADLGCRLRHIGPAAYPLEETAL